MEQAISASGPRGHCRYPVNRVPAYTGQKLSTALNKAPRSLAKKGFSPFLRTNGRGLPANQREQPVSPRVSVRKEPKGTRSSDPPLVGRTAPRVHVEVPNLFPRGPNLSSGALRPQEGSRADPARGGPKQPRAIHPARKLRAAEGARPRNSLVRGRHVSPGHAAGPPAAGHTHLTHSLRTGGRGLTSADGLRYRR